MQSAIVTHRYGAFVLSLWIPLDIWQRIAYHLATLSRLKHFQSICQASYHAVTRLQHPRHQRIRANFLTVSFVIPEHLLENVLMVHPVPPNAQSLIIFLDSQSGYGIDLAWIRNGHTKTLSLGLETVPASTVSNIRFSPDGTHLALLVTLAHGTLLSPEIDPLHRLRGWDSVKKTNSRQYDISYYPCDDCTVQIIHLQSDANGTPTDLILHTFSHVFVPEYGFDMLWRHIDSQLQLCFAAMLHSTDGAATYLVRWTTFQHASKPNFVFMSCLNGASTEMSQDKRSAMLVYDSTFSTSRIEIGGGGNTLFFDTMSKYGTLTFDQIEDADTSRVAITDLYSDSCSIPDRLRTCMQVRSTTKQGSAASAVAVLRPLNVSPNGGRCGVTKAQQEIARVSRMSPDGKLICCILGIRFVGGRMENEYTREVEMLSSMTGKLIYRRAIEERSAELREQRDVITLEKSMDIAQNTFCFSNDSQLVIIWETYITNNYIIIYKRLPVVIEAKTGVLVQDFGRLGEMMNYEQIQMPPDGRTLYATRLSGGHILVDAIDVLCASILKTIEVGESMSIPKRIAANCVFKAQNGELITISKGSVDVLWDTTRGALGCGWLAQARENAGSN